MLSSLQRDSVSRAVDKRLHCENLGTYNNFIEHFRQFLSMRSLSVLNTCMSSQPFTQTCFHTLIANGVQCLLYTIELCFTQGNELKRSKQNSTVTNSKKIFSPEQCITPHGKQPPKSSSKECSYNLNMKHWIDIVVTVGKSVHNDITYAIDNHLLPPKGTIDKTYDINLRNVF